MDEFVRDGLLMLIAAAVAALAILAGTALLALRLLQAAVAGDLVFPAACAAVLVFFIALYIGIGIWLRRTGRI